MDTHEQTFLKLADSASLARWLTNQGYEYLARSVAKHGIDGHTFFTCSLAVLIPYMGIGNLELTAAMFERVRGDILSAIPSRDDEAVRRCAPGRLYIGTGVVISTPETTRQQPTGNSQRTQPFVPSGDLTTGRANFPLFQTQFTEHVEKAENNGERGTIVLAPDGKHISFMQETIRAEDDYTNISSSNNYNNNTNIGNECNVNDVINSNNVCNIAGGLTGENKMAPCEPQNHQWSHGTLSREFNGRLDNIIIQIGNDNSNCNNSNNNLGDNSMCNNINVRNGIFGSQNGDHIGVNIMSTNSSNNNNGNGNGNGNNYSNNYNESKGNNNRNNINIEKNNVSTEYNAINVRASSPSVSIGDVVDVLYKMDDNSSYVALIVVKHHEIISVKTPVHQINVDKRSGSGNISPLSTQYREGSFRDDYMDSDALGNSDVSYLPNYEAPCNGPMGVENSVQSSQQVQEPIPTVSRVLNSGQISFQESHSPSPQFGSFSNVPFIGNTISSMGMLNNVYNYTNQVNPGTYDNYNINNGNVMNANANNNSSSNNNNMINGKPIMINHPLNMNYSINSDTLKYIPLKNNVESSMNNLFNGNNDEDNNIMNDKINSNNNNNNNNNNNGGINNSSSFHPAFNYSYHNNSNNNSENNVIITNNIDKNMSNVNSANNGTNGSISNPHTPVGNTSFHHLNSGGNVSILNISRGVSTSSSFRDVESDDESEKTFIPSNTISSRIHNRTNSNKLNLFSKGTGFRAFRTTNDASKATNNLNNFAFPIIDEQPFEEMKFTNQPLNSLSVLPKHRGNILVIRDGIAFVYDKDTGRICVFNTNYRNNNNNLDDKNKDNMFVRDDEISFYCVSANTSYVYHNAIRPQYTGSTTTHNSNKNSNYYYYGQAIADNAIYCHNVSLLKEGTERLISSAKNYDKERDKDKDKDKNKEQKFTESLSYLYRSSEMYIGVVYSYNTTNTYGFIKIVCENKKDVFSHKSLKGTEYTVSLKELTNSDTCEHREQIGSYGAGEGFGDNNMNNSDGGATAENSISNNYLYNDDVNDVNTTTSHRITNSHCNVLQSIKKPSGLKLEQHDTTHVATQSHDSSSKSRKNSFGGSGHIIGHNSNYTPDDYMEEEKEIELTESDVNKILSDERLSNSVMFQFDYANPLFLDHFQDIDNHENSDLVGNNKNHTEDDFSPRTHLNNAFALQSDDSTFYSPVNISYRGVSHGIEVYFKKETVDPSMDCNNILNSLVLVKPLWCGSKAQAQKISPLVKVLDGLSMLRVVGYVAAELNNIAIVIPLGAAVCVPPTKPADIQNVKEDIDLLTYIAIYLQRDMFYIRPKTLSLNTKNINPQSLGLSLLGKTIVFTPQMDISTHLTNKNEISFISDLSHYELCEREMTICIPNQKEKLAFNKAFANTVAFVDYCSVLNKKQDPKSSASFQITQLTNGGKMKKFVYKSDKYNFESPHIYKHSYNIPKGELGYDSNDDRTTHSLGYLSVNVETFQCHNSVVHPILPFCSLTCPKQKYDIPFFSFDSIKLHNKKELDVTIVDSLDKTTQRLYYIQGTQQILSSSTSSSSSSSTSLATGSTTTSVFSKSSRKDVQFVNMSDVVAIDNPVDGDLLLFDKDNGGHLLFPLDRDMEVRSILGYRDDNKMLSQYSDIPATNTWNLYVIMCLSIPGKNDKNSTIYIMQPIANSSIKFWLTPGISGTIAFSFSPQSQQQQQQQLQQQQGQGQNQGQGPMQSAQQQQQQKQQHGDKKFANQRRSLLGCSVELNYPESYKLEKEKYEGNKCVKDGSFVYTTMSLIEELRGRRIYILPSVLTCTLREKK